MARIDIGKVFGGSSTNDDGSGTVGGSEPGAMTGPANMPGTAPAAALDTDDDPTPERVAETGGNAPSPGDNPTPNTVDVTQVDAQGERRDPGSRGRSDTVNMVERTAAEFGFGNLLGPLIVTAFALIVGGAALAAES